MGSQKTLHQQHADHPSITMSNLNQDQIGSGLQEESKTPTLPDKNTTGPQNLNLGASFAPSLRQAASVVDLTRQNMHADFSGQLPYSSGIAPTEGAQPEEEKKEGPDEESEVIIKRPPNVGKRGKKLTDEEKLQNERAGNPFRMIGTKTRN